MDGFDEFPVGQENSLLSRMLKAVGIVEIARVLCQESGVRDVEHFAFGVLEFFSVSAVLPLPALPITMSGGGWR